MTSTRTAEFSTLFQDTAIVGDRQTPAETSVTAMLLHGAGASSSAGFVKLRAHLEGRGIETVAFDFAGHGRSMGQQLGTTLSDRVNLASSVVNTLGLDSRNLAIVGFSMGAYVALKVTLEIGARRLCLAVPAAYTPQAFSVPFGPMFTQLLRSPGSWHNSDAFDLMQAYSGHLLVLSSLNDQTIPHQIPQRYFSEAQQCLSRKHLVFSNSGHKLNDYFEVDTLARDAAYDEIATLCLRPLQ